MTLAAEDASLRTATAAAPAQVDAAPPLPAPAPATAFGRFLAECEGFKKALDSGFISQSEYDQLLATAKRELLPRALD